MARPNSLEPSDLFIITELLKELSPAVIADKFDVHSDTIKRYLKRYGVLLSDYTPIRIKHRREPKITRITRRLDEGLSVREIAMELSTDRTSLHTFIKKHNIRKTK